MLIFVYNAKSGRMNLMLDIAHKVISPGTYDCQLCSLTHGTFQEKKAWIEFCSNLDQEMIFLHKDEFEERYETTSTYPVIYRDVEGTLEEFMAAYEINEIKGLGVLMERVKERL